MGGKENLMRHLLPFQYVEAIAKAGSIRKAAELLAITPSALNRRLLSVEDELGVAIFERLPAGVRLNTAGEILLEHIRNQLSDMERVKSQIADLSGVRRGHVTIACSPEVMGGFLPEQVLLYQRQFPGVTFSVDQYFRGAAETALVEHTADIALVFEPLRLADFQTVLSLRQPLVCLVPADHPLAARDVLRLYECAEYPMQLPEASLGVRYLLEQSALKLGLKFRTVIQSNSQEFLRSCGKETGNLSFDIAVNITADLKKSGLKAIPINTLDVPEGFLFVGHLKGRALPVAAARFMEQISTSLAAQFE